MNTVSESQFYRGCGAKAQRNDMKPNGGACEVTTATKGVYPVFWAP